MRLIRLIGVCLAAIIGPALIAKADQAQQKPGIIVATYAADAQLCGSFIDDGNSVGHRLEPLSNSGGSFRIPPGGKELNAIALPGSAVYTIDFDNDGQQDRVLWTTDYTHYFDGDYFVILPSDAEADARREYDKQREEDINAFVAWARATGISVYAGDTTPYRAIRYTRFVPIIIENTTLLWTLPQNRKWLPTALLYKPHPNGVLERICEYQRVEK